MERHPPAYLSPSRLATYDRCPALFHERYILKTPQPPSVEMLFGVAVHKGIEAQFRGEDDEMAFLADWRKARTICEQAGLVFSSSTMMHRGLEMLSLVRDLKLAGVPERKFVCTRGGFIIPFLGFIDLWGDDHLYDFKTTGFGWTQKQADDQLFQPAIYSHAYAVENEGRLPRFTFVVLPRTFGPAQILDGTRTAEQIDAAFDRIMDIHVAIENRLFDCTCEGRYHAQGRAA